MSGVIWSALPSPTLRLLSLGAGVQSSTLLLMAMAGEVEGKLDGAIFSDTGWEPQAVYDWFAYLRSIATIPIHIVSAGNIRADVIASATGDSARNPPFWIKGADGRAAPLRRKCTSNYKLEPIEREVRRLLGVERGRRVPKGTMVEKWIGISQDEVVRVKPSGSAWTANRYPLIELGMTRDHCLSWMKAHGYPDPPKSACIGCPYRSDASWRAMKEGRPEEFQDAVDFERAILGGINGTAKPGVYLHRSLVPLDQVEFKVAAELPLFGEFAAECEGMCGV